jgi:uncharacterized protein YegL
VTLMLLPVYLIVDVSASMGTYLKEMNRAISGFFDRIRADPVADDMVQLSVITFANEARVLIPMRASTESDVPYLTLGVGTHYGPVFRLLKYVIPEDVARLRLFEDRIFRPLAFFVTDGPPSDQDWTEALGEIQDPVFRYSPTIIALGFSAADPSALRAIAGSRGRAFVATEAASLPRAIDSIFNGMLRALTSTVTSSVSAAGGPAIPLPPEWIDVSGESI